MISQEGVALEIDTFSNDKNRSRLQWISDGLGEKDTQGGADRIILLESDVLDLLLVYHQALRNTRKKIYKCTYAKSCSIQFSKG